MASGTSGTDRFRGWIDAGVVDIRHHHLRDGLPPVRASVILGILTLQFVPIEHRPRLLRQCFEGLLPGGAMIVVEKVLGATSAADGVLVDAYTDLKRRNGYTADDVARKRLALEGVLVPLTAGWNEQALTAAGFGSRSSFKC